MCQNGAVYFNLIFEKDKLSRQKTCQNVTFFRLTLTIWQFQGLARKLLLYYNDGVFTPSYDVEKLSEGTETFPHNFHAILKEEFSNMALVPLGDRILVKRSDNDEQTTSGGIIIPDTAKEKPQEGEVVAVGSGRLLDSGDRQPVDVGVGDLILFAKYGGTEVTYDNTEYLILREDDILAKVN